jgi:hypothetical protein
MLKFAETAQIGDVIKAFDFKPMEGREDSFLIGKVIAKGPIKRFEPELDREIYLCDGYTIEITECSDNVRTGDTGYVPFQVSMMEYDERVQVVEAA